ncbi:MAG: cell division regulator GpsB [Bacilli bacterium]|nr:cell division regulator GpsB [Bacilli bacterium]
MNNDVNLTIEDIYEKEFKIDARGYRPQEVDKYLDIIMHDYQVYNSILKKNNEEIKALNEELNQYKQEVRRLKTLLDTASENAAKGDAINNVDLLRRLSNLEKVVFGKNE